MVVHICHISRQNIRSHQHKSRTKCTKHRETVHLQLVNLIPSGVGLDLNRSAFYKEGGSYEPSPCPGPTVKRPQLIFKISPGGERLLPAWLGVHSIQNEVQTQPGLLRPLPCRASALLNTPCPTLAPRGKRSPESATSH